MKIGLRALKKMLTKNITPTFKRRKRAVKRQKAKPKRNPQNKEPNQTFLERVLERMLKIPMMASILHVNDQYRCPRGRRGRCVAKQMNEGHEPLTLWGLSKVKIAPNYVILDIGCGGGKTLSRLAQLAPLGKVLGVDNSHDMVEYSENQN
jgi:2-polyprenyl-3-methyl-5-hydroxy-6-metoxy-1,4-benzoquinol methylase